jgi:hypothetical protein
MSNEMYAGVTRLDVGCPGWDAGTRCVTLPVRRGGRCCLRGRLRRATAMQREQSEVRSSRACLCVLARRSRRSSAREVVAGSNSTLLQAWPALHRAERGWKGKCDDVPCLRALSNVNIKCGLTHTCSIRCIEVNAQDMGAGAVCLLHI